MLAHVQNAYRDLQLSSTLVTQIRVSAKLSGDLLDAMPFYPHTSRFELDDRCEELAGCDIVCHCYGYIEAE